MAVTLAVATRRVFWKCTIRGCRAVRVTEQPVPRPGSVAVIDASGQPFGLGDWAFGHGAIRACWEHNGLICADHNTLMQAATLKATYNPAKICDGKCINARRASCDCSCNGENHGRGNVWI